MPIPRLIVFTGGPRGGKGEAITSLEKQLRAQGVGVSVIPEIATVLMERGFHPNDSYKRSSALWDKARVQMQLRSENEALKAVQGKPGPHAILADRGIPDGSVFCTPAIWKEVLDTFKLTSGISLRRYDAVIHMVSTAVDLPGVYDNASNPHRYHNEQEARVSDLRLGEIWKLHPHYHRLDNSVGITEKIARALPLVMATVNRGPTIPARLGQAVLAPTQQNTHAR